MKKIISLILGLLSLLATPQVRAWSYSDGDLLLIFRESGYNDVEYDLGSVTNLLGYTNGYATAITGWDPSIVTTEFGPDLTGVNVILLAVTSSTNANPTAWLTSTDPNTTAYRASQSAWTSDLHATIAAIGNKPISPFDVPTAEANAYSINPNGQYGGAAYDTIASGGTYTGTLSIGKFGGNAPFTVQQTAPGSLDFWAIQPAIAASVPDQLIGTFTITADGALTFVAGPRPSTIAGVNHAGNVSAIQFTTTIGTTYSVAYTNQLGFTTTAWPVDVNTLVGDGRTDTINHTNLSSGNAEFYRVIAQ